MLQAYRLYLFQTIFAEGADAMPPCVQYDDLWPGGPRFARSGAGFALGTDSVLLADFAADRRVRRPSAWSCSRTRRSSAGTISRPTA